MKTIFCFIYLFTFFPFLSPKTAHLQLSCSNPHNVWSIGWSGSQGSYVPFVDMTCDSWEWWSSGLFPNVKELYVLSSLDIYSCGNAGKHYELVLAWLLQLGGPK